MSDPVSAHQTTLRLWRRIKTLFARSGKRVVKHSDDRVNKKGRN